MALVYHERGIALHHGDCLTVLRELPDNSIDAMVTDPPAGIAFMGKEWDHDRGGRDQWIRWLTTRLTETFRVLKPGAHVLVWALPRTSHWTALALEDAGYEIRDCVTHLFGTGFPKSLDIGKAIDRAAGAERGPGSPGRYTSRRPRADVQAVSAYNDGVGDAGSALITAPASDAAKRWDGWGTALKPASEHWWLARKPITGTIAHNVMEYGTGALNINTCRVPGSSWTFTRGPKTGRSGGIMGEPLAREGIASSHPSGRWPANVVLTHQPLLTEHGDIVGDACADGCVEGCPVLELDTQTAYLHSAGGECATRRGNMNNGLFGLGSGTRRLGDSGGASRFFPTFRYQAKAPTTERPKIDGKAHPTVKALALMQWLTRLITPPAGTILDPFCGTGTTGQAARTQGFNAILIDNDPESVEWTIQRLTTTLL